MTDDEYLDQLQEATEKLLLLLKDRQPGLKTWWIALMKAHDEVLRRAGPHKRLPLASELTGSDPEFTGTLSTDEYIKSIRNPSE